MEWTTNWNTFIFTFYILWLNVMVVDVLGLTCLKKTKLRMQTGWSKSLIKNLFCRNFFIRFFCPQKQDKNNFTYLQYSGFEFLRSLSIRTLSTWIGSWCIHDHAELAFVMSLKGTRKIKRRWSTKHIVFISLLCYWVHDILIKY